jgi:hypothetical protein
MSDENTDEINDMSLDLIDDNEYFYGEEEI